MRTIREMVKTELDLEDEVADSAGFKSQVKEIVEKKMFENEAKTSASPVKRKKKTSDKNESGQKERKSKIKEEKEITKESKIKTSEKKATAENDNDQIKQLKMYISKCGVRKAWKKELEGLSTDKQIIARLKSILEELGMEGRPSLSKCKEIRDKIEAEKEMECLKSENIVEGGRKSRREKQPPLIEYESDEQYEDDQLSLIQALGDPDAE